MGDDDGKPPDIESFTVATIAMWLRKMPPHHVIALVHDHIKPDDLYDDGVIALNKLVDIGGFKKIAKHGEMKKLAEVVVTVVEGLTNKFKDMKFMIPHDKLDKVPGVISTSHDANKDRTVSARLDNLEKQNDEIKNLLNQFRNSAPSSFASIATKSPAVQLNGNHLHPAAAASGGDRGRAPVPGGPGLRQRSTSGTKRGHDDENRDENSQQWRTAGRRRKPQVQGCSKAKLSANITKAIPPFEVVIGNTHTDCTEEIIGQALMEISKDMPDDMKLEEDLEIFSIERLTPPARDDFEPWRLSWKVKVPAKFREHMLRPESIPDGWTSRRYFPRRQRPPDNSQLTKRQNTGDSARYPPVHDNESGTGKSRSFSWRTS